MVNDNQVFSGDVPANYEQRMLPLLFADYARDLAGRVAAHTPDRVLETACGTGAVTRELRRCLPESTAIVSTDLSAPMLDSARANVVTGVEFQQADACALPFADAEFDVVVCQFGVMFFPDKRQGFAEALRVLRPGGHFVFNTWDSFEQNPIPAIAREATRAFVAQNTAPFMAAPFAYFDGAQIQADLQGAGFAAIKIQTLAGTARAPCAKKIALAITLGSPLGAELAEQGQQQAGMAAIEQALTKRYGDGEISAPMQALIVEARRV